MTSCILRRVRAVCWAALWAVILPTFACSGGSGGSAPFEIVSPSSRTVVVQPGQSVRFEIRANGGRSVEYVIDDLRTEPGPVFVFQPVAQHHVVEALILPSDLSAPPDIVLFTVDVEAPGNLPPQITSFTVEPERTGTGGSSWRAASAAAAACASRSGSTHCGRRLRPRPRRAGC